MIAPVPAGALRRALLVGLAAAALATRAGAAHAAPDAPAAPPARPIVAVSVIGGTDADADLLHVVLDEQMRDESADVTWSRAATFVAGELFDRAGSGGARVVARGARVWIDLSSPGKARLFLKDQPSRRFVVRAVALPSGLDEMGREAIGQIVRCAVLAVLADGGGALSADEARLALARLVSPPPASGSPPGARPPVLAVAPAAGVRAPSPPPATIAAGGAPAGGERAAPSRPTVEVAPFVTALLYSPQAPLAEEVSLVASLRSRRWPVDLWSEIGYRLPISWRGDSVGVDTAAAAGRLGVAWRVAHGPAVSLRLGAGAGVERVRYSPTGDATAVDLAPTSSFWSPEARLLAAADVRLSGSLALSVRLSGDIALLDVHYDFGEDPPRRVLAPFPVRAGIGLGLTWRL